MEALREDSVSISMHRMYVLRSTPFRTTIGPSTSNTSSLSALLCCAVCCQQCSDAMVPACRMAPLVGFEKCMQAPVVPGACKYVGLMTACMHLFRWVHAATCAVLGEEPVSARVRAQVEPGVQKLFEYIYERGTIIPIEDYSAELLQHGDVSQIVTESIRAGTPDWEALVPRHVCEQV